MSDSANASWFYSAGLRHDSAQKRFEMISIAEGRAGIESIAKGFEIEGRIDGIESKQFIATNIWE